MEHNNSQKGVFTRAEHQDIGTDERAIRLGAEATAVAGRKSVGALAVARQIEPEGAKPGRAEQVAALQKQITGAVEALVDAGAWQRMLQTAGRFHDYSFGNQLLIATQFPNATRVAGYRAWQKLDRQVRRGERSIAILAPMTYVLEPDTEAQDAGAKPKVIQRFKIARVFDISQTDGDPLPGLPDRLTGNADQALWDGLACLVAARGYNLIRTAQGPDGYTSPKTRTVGVRANVDQAHATMTLMHELAHIWCGHVEQGYDYRTHRGTAEVEAQSVAYIVAAACGLDATAYTTDYVIGWAKGDLAAIRATAQKVTTVAHDVLEALAGEGA